LRYIHEREHLDAVIPTLDSEMMNFISIRSDLETLGIGILIPTEGQFEKRSKVNLSQLADECGVKTPETNLMTDLNQIAAMSF